MENPITEPGIRTDAPTTSFVEGEVLNNEVWDLVDQGKGVYFPSLRKERPASWPQGRRVKLPVYKTFISVGVMAGSVGFGLITINALRARQLTSEDFRMVTLLAQMLAMAEALCLGTQGLNRLRASQPRTVAVVSIEVEGGHDE